MLGHGFLAGAAETAASQYDFFEKRIRPVLVDTCYRCHSSQSGKAKGGLLLDTKAALLKGGDSGPAIVPGKPEESLLIKAIRYTDAALQMPPDSAGGKLPSESIAAFENWVKAGAPDPRREDGLTKPTPSGINWAKAREHWAFKPVRAPSIPVVQAASWIRTPVDAFVMAKLEAKSLKPSPTADKRTLLRRIYFDLIGLPPSPTELDQFLSDESPDAFERVVDHLLGSPRYGERWARYWLDIARYADTKGYVFQEERRYAYSYTYRDYVIRAFNEDKPYDRFLIEQIAADRLELNEDKTTLAALGCLTLGRRFLNNQNDIIDDRIDVVSRGMMGLTVGCARCHDHKFDPIPTQDYYSLHGIFASSEEPEEKPLLGKLIESPAYKDFLQQRAEIEEKQEVEIEKEAQKYLAKERGHVGDYLLAANDARPLGQGEPLTTFAGQRKVERKLLQRWMAFLEARRTSNDAVLGPWFAFAALPEKEFGPAAKALAGGFATNLASVHPVNGLVAWALVDAAPASLKDVTDIYTKIFNEADQAWTNRLAAARKSNFAPPTALPDPDQESVRQLLYAENSPLNLSPAEVRQLIARHLSNVTVKFRQEIAALDWKHPGAPARAMALLDKPQARNSRIFIRGNPGNPGGEAPRQFLEILAGPNRRPFTRGSGRLELAQAIASRENPLTARVFVNRVWGWHFGAALVRTPSDFGVRTEAPVQQDLLDWLAANFMEQGWSIKKLHRLIVLSNTYRQASDAEATVATLDPDNQLLQHFNRHRLEFEAMRDSLLAVSGKLDATVGGQPVDILSPPFSGRRTIYGFIDRQNLPGLFRTFDLANPDSSAPQRFATTVPQQALFLMNSPFVMEQVRALIKRIEGSVLANDSEKIRALYQLVFQRAPAPDEIKMAEEFLGKNHETLASQDTGQNSEKDDKAKVKKPLPLSLWEQLAQVFLLANEFIFVD